MALEEDETRYKSIANCMVETSLQKCCVARRSLIKDEQLTGESRLCVIIDATSRKVDVAMIRVDTPFYVGEIEVLCMDNPLYDLILGNTPSVRDPRDPNPYWIGISSVSSDKTEDEMVTCAVQTRR